MKHFLKPLMVVAIAAIIALPAYALIQARVESEQIIGGLAGNIVDVVGSRIGTTTTAVNFATHAATTTYPILIGREYDSVEFNVLTTEASSTPDIRFSILASNDYDCDTASTTTTMDNTVVMKDINWFDAGLHLLNLAGTKDLGTGTSTFTWIPSSKVTGKQFVLQDLHVNCLALQANASGTSLFIQAQKKNLAR